METSQQTQSTLSARPHRHVVLFYRYFLPTNTASTSAAADEPSIDEATLQFFQKHATNYLPLLQKHQTQLCRELGNMKGRVLLSTEGINGTLSCPSEEEMMQYKERMEAFDLLSEFATPDGLDASNGEKPKAGKGRLFAGIDWKTSSVDGVNATFATGDATEQQQQQQQQQYQDPFPDLKISIVKEIVNTGCIIKVKDIPRDSGNEISPEEFHSILLEARGDSSRVVEGGANNTDTIQAKKKEVVLIDVRNTFEHAIGHFVGSTSSTLMPNKAIASNDYATKSDKGASSTQRDPPSDNTSDTTLAAPALNPNTVTFSHFDSNFCSQYSEALKDKKVLMYCTGGIRCVKASVMLKQRGVEDVSHLKGGIHRYLEKYGSEGFYKGKIMVFDQRVALDPDVLKKDASGSADNIEKSVAVNAQKSNNENVVGECIECNVPYDRLSGANLCTVCRDLILICPVCRESKHEYHCERHQSWRNAYFTFLDRFTRGELELQHKELQKVHDSYLPPKEHKNVRRTLRKQMVKVLARVNALVEGTAEVKSNALRRCRTCFESEDMCDGLCWGFWKHSQSPYQKKSSSIVEPIIDVKVGDRVTPGPNWNEMRLGSRCYSAAQEEMVSNKMARTSEESNERLQPVTHDARKVGTVVEVKSWASGGNKLDCVAVIWDDDPSGDSAHCGSRRRKKRKQQPNDTLMTEEYVRQSEIYRWGALARNGQRMYDVKREEGRVRSV